jgi:hypothetical protein
MGTITTIGDLDSVRWPNSHWRSVKVMCRDFRILAVLLFHYSLGLVKSIATCHMLHGLFSEN